MADKQQPMCVAVDYSGPQSALEAKWFYDGFRAGLTAYAREIGHSCLRSENAIYAKLSDEQGLETIGLFKKFGDGGEEPGREKPRPAE